jgi:hypothetical protein
MVSKKWSPKARSGRLLASGVGLLMLAVVSGAQHATPAANALLAASTSAGERDLVARHIDHLAKVGKDILNRLRPEIRDRLSFGGQELLAIADKVDKIKQATVNSQGGKTHGPKGLPQGLGSDPFAVEDFATRLGGMTQSETSVAWCGPNALIGFNDSGSLVATLFLTPTPSGSISANGWSRSTNAGGSYTDMGALTAEPIPAGLMFRDLFGDPGLACTSSSNFYYSSLALDTGPDFSFADSGISVSRSTDGGASFGPAVMAASKDANTHFLDKPWMAVSPGPTASADDDVIHITYTDFDFSAFENPDTAVCPNDVRVAIEHVRSTDGGATWSDPQVIEEVCNFTDPTAQFLQGSQVETGVGDDVYVAWEHFMFDFSANVETRDIRIRKSTDGGQSFGDTNVVTSLKPIGDGTVLQGLFRDFLDLQGLGVDRSSGPHSGSVYISFQDGSNRSKPDPFGFCGGAPEYCFGDVLATRSDDGGATWSGPVRINDDSLTLGIDQFMPALDVDRSGNVWVAFYDRRRDTRNFLIDTFVAKSTNGGAKWTNSRATSRNFAPVTGWQDLFINPAYMGDYIAVAADSLGSSPGVIAAWGDNSLGDANVLQRRF